MAAKLIHVEEVMQTYEILSQLSPLSQCYNYSAFFSIACMHVAVYECVIFLNVLLNISEINSSFFCSSYIT